jgi:RNA polymerase sigma-70 factor (ECF subfamily)
VNKRLENPSIPAHDQAETGIDDRELVERARVGDEDAFRSLFERYYRRAYSLACGVVRNPDDALDVVQEAFIKAHRHIGKFEGTSSFYTWLYRIVANLCIDHLRRAGRKKDVEFDDRLRHDGEQDAGGDHLPISSLGDPSEAVKNKEILAAVEESLGHLSDKHRAVIVMRELQGLSYADMAKAMNCSKGTIMSRLFHARRNMQKLLKERLEHVPRPSDGGDGDGEQDDSLSHEAAS